MAKMRPHRPFVRRPLKTPSSVVEEVRQLAAIAIRKIQLNRFIRKSLAVATAAVCGAGAHAGTVSTTISKYAVEAITSSTPVTLAPIIYRLGVARGVSQPFTITLRPPDGASTTLKCSSSPTISGGGAANITVKRTSPSECVWDVSVTTSLVVGTNLTLSNVTISGHSLATVGATEHLNVALYDTGETARVDSSSDLGVTVATSGQAITLTAPTDAGTTADVLFKSGVSPLFGFVAQNNDTTTNASANFTIGVDGSLLDASRNAVRANSVLTNIVVTVAGDFSGLITSFSGAGNSSVRVNGNGGAQAPAVSYNATAGTAVFTLSGTSLVASGTTAVQVSLQTSQTKSLGLSRTFGVSAVAKPKLAGAPSFAIAGNPDWWEWNANSIELSTAYFSTESSDGNQNRFFFQSLSKNQYGYAATCYAESGVTVTYGTARSGKLAPNGVTALNAADICTFSSSNRGSITFTINATAVGNVKGVYQQATNGGAAVYIPLERTYGKNRTSNGTNY